MNNGRAPDVIAAGEALKCFDRYTDRVVAAMQPRLGDSRVRLPLGGVASSDPAQVRPPWVRPFWLLAGALAAAIGLFMWIRLGLG